MPRIDNWFRFGDGLAGQITEHTAQDTFKRKMQWTSRLVEMNEEEGWCQTENTRYELGKKAETADPYLK